MEVQVNFLFAILKKLFLLKHDNLTLENVKNVCRIFFRHNKRARRSIPCILKESKEHTNPMSIQSDNIRAAVILDRVKGCKVEDNKGNQYSIVDVKVFNGLVSTIGLKDVPTGFIKYASFDAYMEMASVA